MLAERLLSAGRQVVTTREPGGTQLGERIRQVVLASGGDHDALVDALLFNAARRQLVRDVILPGLARGAVVMCDRFADSTLAYQGFGGGAPGDALRQIAAAATGGLTPDRTLLFDLEVSAGLTRRRDGEREALTKFEIDTPFGAEFHERVRRGFLTLAANEPSRWRVVDASGSPDEVAEQVWAAVADLFEERDEG